MKHAKGSVIIENKHRFDATVAESKTKCKNEIMLEEYRGLKTEIRAAINNQYYILSLLITATSAIMVYVATKYKSGFSDTPDNIFTIITCFGLLLPGVYAFFGTLWLDQVYRQRRAAVAVHKIEEQCKMEGNPFGWEHFINQKSSGRFFNLKYRYYYYVCMGLFYFGPLAVFLSLIVLTIVYDPLNTFFITPTIHRTVCIVVVIVGFLLYVASVIFFCGYRKDITNIMLHIQPRLDIYKTVKSCLFQTRKDRLLLEYNKQHYKQTTTLPYDFIIAERAKDKDSDKTNKYPIFIKLNTSKLATDVDVGDFIYVPINEETTYYIIINTHSYNVERKTFDFNVYGYAPNQNCPMLKKQISRISNFLSQIKRADNPDTESSRIYKVN